MRHPHRPFRIAAVALVALATLGTSGCSWFRKTNALYAESPESRPLEVPPDLDLPRTDGAMALPPAGTQSVSRSDIAPAPAASGATVFVVEGERDAVFDKIGQALSATDGLTVINRAQILGAYDVDYRGSKFLVRVGQAEVGVQVSAVDPRGLPAEGEAPVALIAALKAALGAGG